MNEKQAIAEAERRFENWWEHEGKWSHGHREDRMNQWIYYACKEAWMNGAFCDKG